MYKFIINMFKNKHSMQDRIIPVPALIKDLKRDDITDIPLPTLIDKLHSNMLATECNILQTELNAKQFKYKEVYENFEFQREIITEIKKQVTKLGVIK